MTMTSSTPNGEAERRIFRRTTATDRQQSLAAILWVTRLAFRYRGRAGLAMAATVAAVSMQLSIPLILGRAVDLTQKMAQDGADPTPLILVALTLLAASVLRGIFTLVQNYTAESVGHAMAQDLRNAIYDKILRLPYSFHDRTHSGDMITVGMLDLEGVRMYFSTALLRTVLLGLLIGLGAFMLLRIDITLGLLALSFVPFAAWRSSVMQLTLRRTWLLLQEKLGVLTQVMEENLAGIRVVRAFAAAPHEMAKFDAASAPALRMSHERIDVRVKSTSAMTLVFFDRDGAGPAGRRPAGGGGHDDRRHAGHLPDLHDDPADAGPPARPDGQRLSPAPRPAAPGC